MISKVNEVADRVFMLGTEHVHWYAIVDGTSITIVDTGMPRYWTQLEDLLSSLGRSLADIEAVLITHADPDHLGNAERISLTSGAEVFVHQADIPAAAKEVRIAPPRLPLWRPAVLSFMAHGIRSGLLSWRAISLPISIEGGGQLDVPGHPIAIHTPGHTPGSVCYAVDDHDVVFVGDALLNKHPVTGEPGCIVCTDEISLDHVQARESIAILDRCEHQTTLFGHGSPRFDGVRSAVRDALST